MPNLTIIYLYYNNPQAILELEEKLVYALPCKFLFVDDGSPQPLILSSNWGRQTKVIRIHKDVPWNMSVANNIALKACDTEYLIRSDIDHYFNAVQYKKMMSNLLSLPHKAYQQFFRIISSKPKVAPNIYMIRTKILISIGGYDERFVGAYGFEDIEIISRLEALGIQCIRDKKLTISLLHLPTTNLDRSTERNQIILDSLNSKLLKRWSRIDFDHSSLSNHDPIVYEVTG